jgi:pimeloyl-ACP methyl ester carboxylesterase
MATAMEKVISRDGTPIAHESVGDGPPLILVGGAFNDRTTVAGLAATLAPHFTAVTYDRRGRGGSGDKPVADRLAAELDDLAAVINAVGRSVGVFGHSSGAVLALEAAAAGLPVAKVAAYDPTWIVDGSRPRPGSDLEYRLTALLAVGKATAAASLFLTEAVGLPSEMVAGMQAADVWPFLVALGPSLPNDVAICGPGMALPAERLSTIRIPTLTLTGSQSPAWLAATAAAVADSIPRGRRLILDGQDHGVLNNPGALEGALVDFFK